MKHLRVIYISIAVLIIITWLGSSIGQKGDKTPFRLKESRLAPLTESEWNEEQVMDVIASVGQYNLVSWMLNSCGVQLEKGVPGFPEGSENRNN